MLKESSYRRSGDRLFNADELCRSESRPIIDTADTNLLDDHATIGTVSEYPSTPTTGNRANIAARPAINSRYWLLKAWSLKIQGTLQPELELHKPAASWNSVLFISKVTVMAAIPPQARSKQLRACLLCSIIQHPMDFRKNGCPNCEELMQVFRDHRESSLLPLTSSQMKGSPDRISVCTTTYFDGIIAVIDAEASWAARWQRTC